jgi:hypothetical protein
MESGGGQIDYTAVVIIAAKCLMRFITAAAFHFCCSVSLVDKFFEGTCMCSILSQHFLSILLIF